MQRRHRRSIAGPALIMIVGSWFLMIPAPASAAPIHVNCDAGGNLQNRIDAAPGGSTILIKGTCDGPFTITGKGLTLDGDPTATLDGQGAGSTLTIKPSGRKVALVDLVVTGGMASPEGGGILVEDSDLTLLRTTVQGNKAVGPDYSYGGGIFSRGTGSIAVISSTIRRNRALTEPATGFAYANGGAIYSEVPVTVTNSAINRNFAVATSTDTFAYAYGGAIVAGDTTSAASTFIGNQAFATGQGDFAYAYGGAIEGGHLTATGSTFEMNVALAQSEATFSYATGGALDLQSGGSVAGSTVQQNIALARAHTDGNSIGGGINAVGNLSVEHSSVAGNFAATEASAEQATAVGGGIFHQTGTLTLRRSAVANNGASAQSHNDAAEGGGGGVDAADTLLVTNSTIAKNIAFADTSDTAGKIATATGGGIKAEHVTLVAATIAGNASRTEGASIVSLGGGVDVGTDLTITASILAGNTAFTGPDCRSTSTTSHGHNLVRRPVECLPAPRPSDITGKPAKLGPLQDNGGPTQTMAIAATSPAFNQIPQAMCPAPFDQRGLHRPQGPRCDIGAFERAVAV
jgi:fibronectin-binding autotransporter adhesin